MPQIIGILGDDGEPTGEWHGVLGDSVFRAITGHLTPENGWDRLFMGQADFEQLRAEREGRNRKSAEIVYRILDNDTREPTGQFFGVSFTGDVFPSVTDGLNPANGWQTVSIPQADFASLMRSRSKRTRFNPVTGEDLTLG